MSMFGNDGMVGDILDSARESQWSGYISAGPRSWRPVEYRTTTWDITADPKRPATTGDWRLVHTSRDVEDRVVTVGTPGPGSYCYESVRQVRIFVGIWARFEEEIAAQEASK